MYYDERANTLVQHWVWIWPNVFLVDNILLRQDLLTTANHSAQHTGKKHCRQRHMDSINTLGPRQNGRPLEDDIFKCIFLNENVWIPLKMWLKFIPKGPINIIPALVQMMAWRRLGDKPLSEPKMTRISTHICVIRPQWVTSFDARDGDTPDFWSIQYLLMHWLLKLLKTLY